MNLKPTQLIYPLILCLFVLFMGCQKDDHQIPKNEGIQFLQSYFTMESFKDSFIKENLKVNWGVHSQEIDSVTNKITYGFETSLKGKLVNDKNQIPYKYEVIAKQRDKDWDFQLVRILANEDTSLDNVTFARPDGFSGTMYFYD